MLFLLTVAGGVWWFLHTRPADEDLILDLVAQLKHGVETKNSQEIMSGIALNYHDKAGLTRTDIGKLAFRWQRTSEQVEVLISDYQLEIKRPKAVGHFAVKLVFNDGETQRLPLVVEFERQRRRWFKYNWLVTSVSGHGLEDDVVGYV